MVVVKFLVIFSCWKTVPACSLMFLLKEEMDMSAEITLTVSHRCPSRLPFHTFKMPLSSGAPAGWRQKPPVPCRHKGAAAPDQ